MNSVNCSIETTKVSLLRYEAPARKDMQRSKRERVHPNLSRTHRGTGSRSSSPVLEKERMPPNQFKAGKGHIKDFIKGTGPKKDSMSPNQARTGKGTGPSSTSCSTRDQNPSKVPKSRDRNRIRPSNPQRKGLVASKPDLGLRERKETHAPVRQELRLSMSKDVIPHPKKAATGGEDAHFITENAFGVFDGVGGSRQEGIDPARYSRKLAKLTAEHVLRNGPGAIENALQFAVENNTEKGTSTACVATLHQGHIRGVNVGDSGLIVIRNEEIVFATEARQHAFNQPYQLGYYRGDAVSDGEFFRFRLHCDDLLIAASDGVWDNVCDADVVSKVIAAIRKYKNSPVDYQLHKACKALSETARRHSGLRTGRSPFSKHAYNAGLIYHGGKVDDITVVMAKVVSAIKPVSTCS